MRRRLVFGNLIITIVVGAAAFALAESGVAIVPLSVIVGTLLVVLTSVHAIAVVNGLLRDLSRVEEAALRVAFGESNVRVGPIAPPCDGLGHRMDQVFARLEEAGDGASNDAPGDPALRS